MNAAFSMAIGNHTACLSRQGVRATRPIGNFSLCSGTLDVTKDLVGTIQGWESPKRISGGIAVGRSYGTFSHLIGEVPVRLFN